MAGGGLKYFDLISSHSCVMLPSLSDVMVLERDKWPVLWVDTRGRRRAGAWETAGGYANLLFVVTDTRVQ